MADSKKPSIEEILAACRNSDGGGVSGAESPAAESASVDKPKAEKSAAEPKVKAATAKDARKMSVADMLAAARGETSGGGEKAAAAAKPGPKKPSPAKKAPKKAAAAKAESAAKAAPTADTSSILAAARAGKRGPVSKAQVAGGPETVKPEKQKAAAPPMPARPSFTRQSSSRSAASVESEARRGFLAVATGFMFGTYWATGLTSLAVTHLLWLLGFARFMFPNVLTEPPTVFKVGFPDELAAGQVQTKFKAQFGVWIVESEYEGQLQIYALKSVCTHLGCTPNWLEAEQKFKCPCHGSGFYKDGVNFEGPAPRPLERYAIRISDDGQLEVDKSLTYQEEMGKWSDPACFISV